MHYRIMFDSTDPFAIPVEAEMVAGYVDGAISAWPAAGWERFPHAAIVRINVTGDPAHGGDELDVERFDATPDHAPGWFDARTQAGARGLSIYCNRDTLPAVNAAMGKRSYFRRIATLDGTLFVEGYKPLEGPAAIQFASAAAAGRNVDVSLVISEYYHPQPSFVRTRAGLLTSAREAAEAMQLLDRYAR